MLITLDTPHPPTPAPAVKEAKILKNSPVNGSGGLSKMSKCPFTQPSIGGSDSINQKKIELSRLGCDLFDY